MFSRINLFLRLSRALKIVWLTNSRPNRLTQYVNGGCSLTYWRRRHNHGREGRAKIYDFGRQCLGKTYKQKRVEVFYAVERGVIITVTVYVFYGEWEP